MCSVSQQNLNNAKHSIHIQFFFDLKKKEILKICLKNILKILGHILNVISKLSRRGPALIITDFDYCNICYRPETP